MVTRSSARGMDLSARLNKVVLLSEDWTQLYSEAKSNLTCVVLVLLGVVTGVGASSSPSRSRNSYRMSVMSLSSVKRTMSSMENKSQSALETPLCIHGNLLSATSTNVRR